MKTSEQRIEELEGIVSELSLRLASMESSRGVIVATPTDSPYNYGVANYPINTGNAYIKNIHPTTGDSFWQSFNLSNNGNISLNASCQPNEFDTVQHNNWKLAGKPTT